MASPSTANIRPAQPTDDTYLAQHFYQMWQDNGVVPEEIKDNWPEITQQFIHQARQELQYQAFVAEVGQEIVGSSAGQLFAGLYPQILIEKKRKYGYIWSVYVESPYRRQGIATQLLTATVEYLRSLQCTRAILHASPIGQPLYTQFGFTPANEMRLDL